MTRLLLKDAAAHILNNAKPLDLKNHLIVAHLNHILATHQNGKITEKKTIGWQSRCYRYMTEDICVQAGTFGVFAMATDARLELDDVVFDASGNVVKFLQFAGDYEIGKNEKTASKRGKKFRPFTNDHAVPLNAQVRQGIKKPQSSIEELYKSIILLNHITQITDNEQRLINDAGYTRQMPNDWDGNVFARLQSIGVTHINVFSGRYRGEHFEVK